jgi:hypothetical protein
MYRTTQLPPSLTRALGEVRALPVDGVAAMTPEERAGWLTGLQQLADAAHAASLAVLASFDANGDGETLHAISRGVKDLPDERVPEAAELLTDLATAMPVAAVVQAGRHLQHVVDPDGAGMSDQHDYARRRLTLSPLLDGMVALDGLLDAEAAATVGAALEPFLVPAGEGDDRTTPQRRADGLVAVAEAAMTQSRLPISGGSRPGVRVVTTLDALREGRGTGVVEPSARGGGVLGAAGCHRRSPTPTTCWPGSTVAPPTWTTRCWSVDTTTEHCTRAVGGPSRLLATDPTVRSASSHAAIRP